MAWPCPLPAESSPRWLLDSQSMAFAPQMSCLLQNVALIVADRPGRMVEKIIPVRDRRTCDPTACRKAAEFTKGWLGVQSPGKERLRANP
jgi:hypothetical protein